MKIVSFHVKRARFQLTVFLSFIFLSEKCLEAQKTTFRHLISIKTLVSSSSSTIFHHNEKKLVMMTLFPFPLTKKQAMRQNGSNCASLQTNLTYLPAVFSWEEKSKIFLSARGADFVIPKINVFREEVLFEILHTRWRYCNVCIDQQ